MLPAAFLFPAERYFFAWSDGCFPWVEDSYAARRDAKGAPGIKFVVSYGYSVAYATEAVLLPPKAVCRTGVGYAD